MMTTDLTAEEIKQHFTLDFLHTRASITVIDQHGKTIQIQWFILNDN